MSKKDFARIAKVDRSTVSQNISRGNLDKAVTGEKNKALIDANHPQAKEFIRKQKIRRGEIEPDPKPEKKSKIEKTGSSVVINKKPPKKPKITPKPNNTKVTQKPAADKTELGSKGVESPYDHIPEDLRMFLDWSFRDIVDRFGTLANFQEFLVATKKIEDIHKTRLENSKTEGLLIKRQLVKEGVVDVINTAHTKLLSDGAVSMSRRVFGIVEAGGDLEDVKLSIKSSISSFISPVKGAMIRAIEETKS